MNTISMTVEQARSLAVIFGRTIADDCQVWLHTYSNDDLGVDIDDAKGVTLEVFRIDENGRVKP